MAYDLGDTVPLTTEILDSTGVLAAATGVVCTVGLPDGTSLTPAVSNPTLGRYTVDFVPTMAGRHTERWTSVSPATARSDIFDVRAATPAYIVSLADAKAHLNLPAASTTNDEELRGFIEACTEVVEELAHEVIVRRTIVERRVLHGARRFALHSVPVISLTSIVDSNGILTWSVGNFDVDPDTGIVSTLVSSGYPVLGTVQLIYVAGYQVIPAKYTRAGLMVLRHLWESQRSSLGGGQRTRLGGAVEDTVMVAGWSVPRGAAELIGARLSGIA
jgi:hypothetical protein